MKLSEAEKAVNACFETTVPVWLWSAPGLGKSSLIHQIGAKRQWPVIDLRAVLMDPTDIRGLPFPDKGKRTVQWFTPEFLPTDGEGILFLDELAQAPELVLNSFFQLVWDRRVGDYKLPPGWRIAAASNRQQDRAGAKRPNLGIMRRFLHLDIEVDHEDWHTWAVSNNILPEVRSFLRFRPNFLHQFEPEKLGDKEKNFPCPSSWEVVSRLFSSLPQSVRLESVRGVVGQAASLEFISYCNMYTQLPDLEMILTDPENATLPSEASVVYAIIGSLTERAKTAKQTVLNAIGQYVFRFPLEYATYAVRDLQGANPSFFTCPSTRDWMKKNGKILSELSTAI